MVQETRRRGRPRTSIRSRAAVAAAAVLCFLGLAAVGVPDALACSVAEGSHCYSISDWEMTKSPEEVEGAYTEIEAYYGNVPNYTSEFIDNEMWVAFPSKEEAWTEAGITFGYGTGSATVPDYFYARSYGPKKYSEYIYPDGPPLNNWSGVYLDEPTAKGTWCVTWSWDHTPDICWEGFPKSSKELNSGLEFATTVSSGSDNNGRNVSWAQWMNGAWHHEWNDGTTHALSYREKPLCIVAPAPGYTWGSVAYSAPGC
jgi:hypothetical protein